MALELDLVLSVKPVLAKNRVVVQVGAASRRGEVTVGRVIDIEVRNAEQKVVDVRLLDSLVVVPEKDRLLYVAAGVEAAEGAVIRGVVVIVIGR